MDGWVDQLRAAATSGTQLDLTADGSSDPAEADAWGPERTLSAEQLREVLLDSALRPDPRGLRLVGARVVGTLDLQGVMLNYPIELQRCFFTHQVDLERATLSALSLSGSHIPGLGADDLRVTHGWLNLSGITATSEVRANGATIHGQLDMTDAILKPENDIALSLDGAHVSGGVFLTGGFSAIGEVRAAGASIDVQLVMRGAHLSSDAGCSLILDGARVAGSLVLDDGFTAVGEVRAVGVTIDGALEMTGASITNSAGNALNMDGARITGPAFLKDGFAATGTVRMRGSTIEGPLTMTGAILKHASGVALDLDRARIAGGLFLNDGFTATGEIRALGGSIGGQLVMTGARLTGGPGPALSLDGAHIADNAYLNERFTATSQVRAAGARIGGSLEMARADLKHDGGDALHLEGVQIAGELNLRHASVGGVYAPHASVGGDIRLDAATLDPPQMRLILNGVGMDLGSAPALEISRADVGGGVFLDEMITSGPIAALGVNIGGQLAARGATLDYLGEDSLALDGARIGGSCFLDEGFSSASQVRAPGAEIRGRLYLQGGSLKGNGDWALNLEGASVGGLLLDTTSLSGGMNARFARLGVVEASGAPPAELAALGWRVDDLSGSLTTVSVIQSWLSSIRSVDFSAQPWHEVAAVIERHGRPSDAKKLRFQAARITTQNSPFWSKVARKAYEVSAGYGYYPLLAGVWLFVAACAAGALTYFFGPVTLNPWLYGAAVVVPSVASITPSSWTVAEPLWLAWCLIVLKGFGWLQTGILLAGLTGLLKKQ